MEKNTDYRDLVLTILELSNDPSPVEVSFGYTDKDKICHQGIVLKKAPPRILEVLIKEGYSAIVLPEGVHIRDYRKYRKSE